MIGYDPGMYEYFEHTADLGIRVRAADLNGLFAEAGTGLFAAVVDGLDTVRPELPVEVAIAGAELDYLLFDWLRELLYRFDADHLLFSRFEVAVSESGLKGTSWGSSEGAGRTTWPGWTRARCRRSSDGASTSRSRST